MPVGNYTAETFLIKDGRVIAWAAPVTVHAGGGDAGGYRVDFDAEAADGEESQPQAAQRKASNGKPTDGNQTTGEPSNRDDARGDVPDCDDAACVSARLVVA